MMLSVCFKQKTAGWLIRVILMVVLVGGLISLPSMTRFSVAYAQIPPVNGPVCGYCGGVGCEHCNAQPPADDNDDDEEDDDDAPLPTPTYVPVKPSAPEAPKPSADPQQVFEQHKEALLNAFRIPAELAVDAVDLSVANAPVVIGGGFGTGAAPKGMTDDEWKQAAESQKTLDSLYAKESLTDVEKATLDELETKRNRLWSKAISTPDLTAEERERLRLKLAVANARSEGSVPTVNPETLKKWQSAPPPVPGSDSSTPASQTVNPVSSWLVGEFATGQVQGALEFGGEQWADTILDDNPFGDFLGVSKIALAYKEGGAASALVEAGNFLVGKIPFPQANLAVEGGRQYANLAFQAQNKFMTDAMKAAGGEFDKDKFWSDFNDDCNLGQKAVKEWVGYGEE